MKTFNSLLALSAVTLLLTVAPTLRAGPPPDYQNRMRSVVSTREKTEAPTKVVHNQPKTLCTHSQNCGCAATDGTKAKS